MTTWNGSAFSRARQWRRIADGSFYMKDVVERMRPKMEECRDDEFFRKLRLLSLSGRGEPDQPDGLLIGVNDTGPLTILDGNTYGGGDVEPAGVLGRFRFICGFSRR